MSFHCLIVDKLHDSIGPLLSAINLDYDYMPDISRDEIKEILANYEGLFIRSKTRVDADLIKGANLKFVARAGAGIDNLDQELLEEKGIEIFNAPEGNRDAVGEHTVGMILNLLHNLTQSHNQIIAGKWDREGNRGRELGSLTVGIFGYGNAGSTLAKKLKGFGCRVIAYDKYLDKTDDSDAELVDLKTFYRETEILSMHLPLTNETDQLASTEFFNKFTHSIIFLNTARGEIAPLNDILKAIEDKKILQVGLDVLECEKFAKMTDDQSNTFNRLKESGKVLFTPHVAGWTFESYQRINVVLVEKIGAFLDRG
ncbi:MAG: phosphoglycerate dehydrogenase [Bacteroidetes bacterium]|nr:MAG: phosphoglycerate dehydrogenase [Bacteroidota bacterium]